MAFEKNNAQDIIKNLEDVIKNDGVLSPKEKQSFLQAYAQDEDTIHREASKRWGEIRNFILWDYGKLSEKLVAKDWIKKAQKALGVKVDGVFWPQTLRETIKFQRKVSKKYANVKIDGIIWPQTLKLLEKEGMMQTAKKISTSAKTQNNEAKAKTQVKKVASTTAKTKAKLQAKETWLNSRELRSAVNWIQKNLSQGEINTLAGKLPGRQRTLEDVVQAVVIYQSKKGLKKDGKPWKNTLKAIGVKKKTMYNSDIKSSNRALQQSEKFGGIEKLKGKWRVIFQEFFLLANSKERKEILSWKYPVALTDTRTWKGIIIMWKKQIEFPVSFSKNKRFVKWASQWDNAVNYGFIEHFTYGRAYKHGGMAIEVREAQNILPGCKEASYKWWHAAAGWNKDGLRNLAYNQQVWEVEVPVTRGTLYSAPNSLMRNGTVFSTSVDLNDIAIDPQIEGDKWKLSTFLTNILYQEMCYLKDYKDCYTDMLRFLRVLEIEDFKNEESYVKNLISEKLVEKISKNKVTSVRLRESLSWQDESDILSWGIAGVYPSENGLYVNPEELTQTKLFTQKYQEFFWGNTEEIEYSVRQRELRYIPIYQKLSLIISDEVEQYISDERQALGQWVIQKSESIWGFILLTPHAQRIYPERTIASQITGFLDNSWVWHYGIEWYFDDILRWNPWELVSKKDIKWRNIDPVSFGNEDIDVLEGVDIQTTIDRNVQRKVEKILEEGVKKYRANRGSVVVLEPKTWKILSLANYPSYDPNSPWEVYDLKKVNYVEYPKPEYDLLGKTVFVEDIERGEKFIYDGGEIYLREAEREEYSDYDKTKYTYKNEFGAGVYKNDTIQSLYEPWSIMKAVTVAIGIDTGEIRPYDFYNDVWSVTIDNFTISNVDSKCLGYNTFNHALAFSCNVGMIRIVQRVGKALLHKYFTDFWFWEATGITLDGEVSSKIGPYEKWPTSKLLTSSYGLWVSVTPLQMATAYATIANEWVYMKPYIVDTITYNDGKIVQYEPEPVRRVLREETAQSVTEMLVTSVDTWVANNGAVPWYSVAGKTGTSQIAYKGQYETWPASTNGSFAGFAPAEDPQFVILVKLERPRTSQYGGSTSAFIFSEIASELLEYYGIPKKAASN